MLNANALLTVEELLEYLQATTATYQKQFLKLYNSSGDATAATVQISAYTMTLVVTGGANAGTSTINLAAADADTAAELVAKINGLGKGWVANLLGRSGLTSIDLNNAPATGALLAANEQTLSGFNRLFLEDVINGISTWIQDSYLHRTIKEVDHSVTPEYYDGDGGRYLFLKAYPITTLTKVESYDPYSAAADELIENTDFLQYAEEGMLKQAGAGWTPGSKNYRVYYKGGYATVPDDIKLAASIVCGMRISAARDGSDGIDSQTIGDYSVSYGAGSSGASSEGTGVNAGLPAQAADILAPYKRYLLE